MHAIVRTGGEQCKVAASEKLKVEQIPADVGAGITLDQALTVGTGDQLRVGASLVNGAAVKATVIPRGRHDRMHIFKMCRRKHYQKRQGHHQNYTELRIDLIVA